jgi:hypothetical protein
MNKKLQSLALVSLLTLSTALAQDYGEHYGVAQTPEAPKELAVPEGHRLSQKALASGVQIYVCSAKADKSGFEWAFKAPEAVLDSDKGIRLGIHYGGPSWEGTDGSKVTGEVKARASSSDPNAIPWLLLATKSAGKEGQFAKTSFIQRLETIGGKAPSTACTETNLNQEARVGYTATYYFYEAK